MLDRTDLDPVFFAPFVSSLMHVDPQWIDYNGHLNMAYYNVLFDRAVDEVYELIGIGADYLKRANHSTFTAEVHVRYVRELHATDGWVSATSENMTLHVDMAAKKVAPFPDSVMRALARMKAVHAQLPRPEAAGRRIAMPER